MHARMNVVLLAAAVVMGCASAASKPPEHAETAAAPPAPPAPVIPADPMVLVPVDAQVVAQLNTDAVEQAPSFARWRRWVLDASCIVDAELAWLTASTSRAVFAGTSTKQSLEVLLVLDGRFAAADRARALTLIDSLLASPPAQPVERAEGVFAVLDSTLASAVVLDDRLLVVGTRSMVSAALARTGATPTELYASTEPFMRLSERLQCASSTGCMVARPDSRATRALGRELRSAGLGSTGRLVADSAVGLSLDVSSGVRLLLSAEMQSEQQAQESTRSLNDWIWRMDVLARLAGLTDVLDEIKVSGSASNVDVRAQLAPNVMATLEERLDVMFEGSSTCGQVATVEPQP